MAQKLHDQYNFSYTTLKVLLGGWNTWKDNNSRDPNTYPIETSTGGPANPTAASNSGAPQVSITIAPAANPTKAP